MFGLNLAPVNPLMRRAKIVAVYAKAGTFLPSGSQLLDLEVDLADAAPHDCPAISTYRVSLREPVWLRAWKVTEGDDVEIGAALALFTQAADTPLPTEAIRAARVAVAGIVSEPDWWDEAVG